MSVTVDVVYEGDLECTLTHGPSGDRLRTDAPVDNRGRGAHFSPTDLVGAAMGSCTLTVMGIVARRRSSLETNPCEGEELSFGLLLGFCWVCGDARPAFHASHHQSAPLGEVRKPKNDVL